jgi:hypothetical protein
MGLIIKCDDLSIHISYSNFEIIQNNLLQSINRYFIHNTLFYKNTINKNNVLHYESLLKKENLYGIYIFFKLNIFNAYSCQQVIDSIQLIYSFIEHTKHSCSLYYLFLYSAISKRELIIK